MNPTLKPIDPKKAGVRPFRSAVLRGLGIVVPPLMTVVIVLWIVGTVQNYLLEPVNLGARNLLIRSIADVRQESELAPEVRSREIVTIDGLVYRRLESGSYIRKNVYDVVAAHAGERQVPATSDEVYARYVELTYLRPYLAIPFFLCLFILALYLLGKFLAAGIGRFFLNLFEAAIVRIPLVRNVYSAVKQVSDFLLTEREFRSSSVVAIEYPRKGLWTIGMVTGEGIADLEATAGEPLLSVFVPTSPMVLNGFIVTIRKSEAIELSITVDQALQFFVSCGVVIPRSQVEKMRVAEPAETTAPPLISSSGVPTVPG